MHRLQLLYGLDLHDDNTLHQQVNPVADEVQSLTFVGETQWFLPLEREPASQQFNARHAS